MNNKGFSFIEVLISLAILTTSVYALIDMQWQAMRQLRLLHIQQILQNQCRDITEKLSVTQQSTLTWQQWQQQLQQQLPQVKIHRASINKNCWQVSFQWTQYQALHQLGQMICKDH